MKKYLIFAVLFLFLFVHMYEAFIISRSAEKCWRLTKELDEAQQIALRQDKAVSEASVAIDEMVLRNQRTSCAAAFYGFCASQMGVDPDDFARKTLDLFHQTNWQVRIYTNGIEGATVERPNNPRAL